jgi:hypothetical protein
MVLKFLLKHHNLSSCFIWRPTTEAWRCCGVGRDQAQSPCHASNISITPNGSSPNIPVGNTSAPQSVDLKSNGSFSPRSIKNYFHSVKFPPFHLF